MRGLLAFYERWGTRLAPFRWMAFSGAIAVASLLWLATATPRARAAGDAAGGALFAVFALGLLGMVWTWGVFLLTVWFAPAPRDTPLVRAARPAGALFLTAWFLGGTAWALWGLVASL